MLIQHSVRRCATAFVFGLALPFATAQERAGRPPPVPSPSVAAPTNLEAPRLPSGADTGIPGSGQKPAVTGNVKGDNTPRKMATRSRGAQAAASGVVIDDRAAARAAARSRPAASAAR